MDASATVEPLAAYLKALAHPKRLQVLQLAVEPRSLDDLAAALGIARQSAQEHVDQLLDLGFLQTRKVRGERGLVTQYALSARRLFTVHEMFAALGSLQSDLEERIDLRLPTMPDKAAAESAQERDLPRITVVHGLRVGRTSALTGGGPWLLGRDPHSLVDLDYDPYASARHAEFRRTRDGFEICDLDSSNGTYLDWSKLASGERVKVENGSLVRIGRTLMLFRRTPPGGRRG